MWTALYLAIAALAAGVTWRVSYRFQSLDAPSEAVRAVAALVAGVLWPVVVLGVLEVQMVRYIARRLRVTPAEANEPNIAVHNRS